LTGEARAFVSLGANQIEPERQIKEAMGRLKTVDGLRFVASSSFYMTEPVGPIAQPPFLNSVSEWRTSLSPRDFLGVILCVEERMGRRRTVRWGPRLIDIDLLLFSDCIIEAPDFKVPHPRMHMRRFVLEPLVEIDPDVLHPVQGKTAVNLLSGLPDDGPWVRRLDNAWE
tara:strand:- start:1761 stop:2270 length:510 start_codon:yes stop_codon:yes gene_type:complete